MIIRRITATLTLLIALVACRTEEQIIPSTPNQVTPPAEHVGDVKGFFLLCEGNMGSNKASIDYFDYATGVYSKNIYAERNPTVVNELGDVGNDIQIYEDRLYAVINGSNCVEVMELATARHIGAVTIPNCRYITFDGSYAYVSSYAGAVQIDPSARLGYVAKVDLESLKVVDECAVGYQPEEMAVVDGKLYVANSGGYRVPNYDTTVSVIDLATFDEVEKIEVAVNLHRIEADDYGFLWVSSRGNYGDVPSKIYVIDTRNSKVAKEFDMPCSNMTRVGDNLYTYGGGAAAAAYSLIDTKKQEIVNDNLLGDSILSNIKTPYCFAVNPETYELFVSDAVDYLTPGKVYCFTADGKSRWSAVTGDVPTAIAFTTKQLQPIN